MKIKAGFNFLAPVYDALTRVVFGRSIVNSQIRFLDHIPNGSKVLMLGGGTGWLLEAIKTPCEIWYIDISERMLSIAGQRIHGNTIHFICGTEMDIPAFEKFDVVITNFYLDLFSDKALNHVVQSISSHTLDTTRWFVTDFVQGNHWWHSPMLKIMYLFFRITCSIEAKALPNWCTILKEHTWAELESEYWYGEFIKACVLKRPFATQ